MDRLNPLNQGRPTPGYPKPWTDGVIAYLPRHPDRAVWVAGAGITVGALNALFALMIFGVGVILQAPGAFESPLTVVLLPLCFFVAVTACVGSVRLLDGKGGLRLLRLGCVGGLVAVAIYLVMLTSVEAEIGEMVPSIMVTMAAVIAFTLSFSRKIARWLAALAARNTASGIGR